MIVEYYGHRFSSITDPLGQLNYQINDSIKRVGVINWWWLTDDEVNLDRLKMFVEQQDVCFFLSEEVFKKYRNINLNEVFTLLNQYNVFYILFSEDYNLSVKPAENKCFYYPWFAKSPLFVPSSFDYELKYKEKPYIFNLLLGSKKSYRTLAFKNLKDNKNVYSSYLGHPKFKNNSATFLDEQDIQDTLINQNVNHEKLNTMREVTRENQQRIISHIIPEKIYANTHFDFVTETVATSGHYFFTEKTAKPLATGRFFCWYASSGCRSYLERYGFDFDNYLANYDNIHNDVDRLDAVFDVVEEITTEHTLLKEIYSRTELVRKHNMETYWKCTNDFNKKLQSWMAECLRI